MTFRNWCLRTALLAKPGSADRADLLHEVIRRPLPAAGYKPLDEDGDALRDRPS